MVAEISTVNDVSDPQGNIYNLAYFSPGLSKPHYITFDFEDSFLGASADPTDEFFQNLWVMANGEMLVAISAGSLFFGSNDYELFQINVPTGTYPSNIQNAELGVQNVSVNSTDTYATITKNQNIIKDETWVNDVISYLQVYATVFKDVFALGVGTAISVASAGTLAPAVAGVVADAGIGAGAVADAIGAAAAASVADAASQEVDIAVTGEGSFNWSQVLTSGLTAVDGSDVIGDLSDLVDPVDGSLVGNVLDAGLIQAADSFTTNLAQGDSLSGALGQAVQGGLSSLAGDVADDLLSSSSVSSTFLQDTISFLDQVSSTVSDLPFANSALSFLTQAVSGGLATNAFAQSAASFLDQIASDNLAGTPFGGYVTSLLNQATTGGLTGSSFAQNALSFLENSVSDELTGSNLVQGLGTFLNQVDENDFSDFANSTLGRGLGSFLQQAVSGDLTASSLAQGLGTFLGQAAGTNMGLDTSSLAQGLGTFLDQAVGTNLNLDTSPLGVGLGDFLQQAVGANLNLDTSPLAVGLGDFLQQAVGTNLNLDTSPLAVGIGDFLQQAVGTNLNLDTSPLAVGLGDFLQQAVGTNLSLDTSPLAVGLGEFLQQAVGTNLNLDTSPLAVSLGDFLQQAAQDGQSFLNSPLVTGAGDFLQQADQDGLDFLNSSVAGEIWMLLQEASQDGTAVSGSALGADVGNFLNGASQGGIGFLNSSFVQQVNSFLDQALLGGITSSTLTQDALSYVNQTISNGAVGSTFAQDALPFFDQAVAGGFTGDTFVQDVESLVSQLNSAGLTDAPDQLPGVSVTNAGLLAALGSACISQGYVSEGMSALRLAEQLDDIPGRVPLTNTAINSITAATGSPVEVLSAGFTDANPNASTATESATISWGDGMTSSGTISPDGSGNFSIIGNHIYATNVSRTLVVTIVDSLGMDATVSTTFTGGLSVSPGILYNFDDGAPNGIDSGDSGIATYVVRNADLTVFTLHNNGDLFAIFGSTFTRIPGTYESVALGPDDGVYALQSSGKLSVVPTGSLIPIPAPVPLTNTAINSITAASGSPVEVLSAGFTDANPNASTATESATISWGDGMTSPGTISSDGSGNFSITGSHIYATNVSRTVVVTIFDSLGMDATVSTTFTGGLSVSPGILYNFDDGAPNGIDSGDSGIATYVVRNADLTVFTLHNNGDLFAVSGSTFAQIPGTYESVALGPDDGVYALQSSGKLSVVPTGSLIPIPAPVPLTNTAINSITAASGSPVEVLSAGFTDANPNASTATESATISWGDGMTSPGTISSDGSGNFSITGSHIYATNVSRTVVVTIFDSVGTAVAVSTTFTGGLSVSPGILYNFDDGAPNGIDSGDSGIATYVVRNTDLTVFSLHNNGDLFAVSGSAFTEIPGTYESVTLGPDGGIYALQSGGNLIVVPTGSLSPISAGTGVQAVVADTTGDVHKLYTSVEQPAAAQLVSTSAVLSQSAVATKAVFAPAALVANDVGQVSRPTDSSLIASASPSGAYPAGPMTSLSVVSGQRSKVRGPALPHSRSVGAIHPTASHHPQLRITSPHGGRLSRNLLRRSVS